jgi:hypothetical protein
MRIRSDRFLSKKITFRVSFLIAYRLKFKRFGKTGRSFFQEET